MLELTTAESAATFALGQFIGVRLQKGDVICLTGDLGAGKTLLVQGIGKGLGLDGEVTSPTFTIMQLYESDRLPVYHFDLYRLENSFELYDIGFEEYVGPDGVAIIEWADKFPADMPAECLWIDLRLGQSENERHITFNPVGRRYQMLCEELEDFGGISH